MKYLKTFEAYGKIDSDIHEDIAKDILPQLQKLREERGSFTIKDFVKYMEERGADSQMIDCVASYIVNMGFDFDIEQEEEITDDELNIRYV